MVRQKIRNLFIAVVVPLLLQGCGGSKRTTASDDTFFTPLTTIAPAVRTEPAVVTPRVPISTAVGRADTLLNTLTEQGRRLATLTEQLRLLESVRRGDRPDSTSGSVQTPVTTEPKPVVLPAGEGEKMIAEAEQLYQARQYRATIDFCQEQLGSGRQKSIEDRYNFLVGASHYRLRQFDLASVFLKRVLEAPGTKKKAEAHFMLGLTYVQLGMTARARAMYEAALRESPPADLAASVRGELRRLARRR